MTFSEMVALIREDLKMHKSDWTRPGFRALAYYRFGVWRMSIEPKLIRAPFSILYRWLYRRARNLYGIELPYSAKIGRRLVIEHQHGIVVHGMASIGDDCIIRQGVTIGNKTTDKPSEAPVIGNRVNIGAGAIILGAINIGDGSSIGANSVVLKDVVAGDVVVGVPAKSITKNKAGAYQ